MSHSLKKALSLLLAVVMVLSLGAFNVLADEEQLTEEWIQVGSYTDLNTAVQQANAKIKLTNDMIRAL